ncbi:MAG: hypothetical protein L6R28_03920 [Planctomycetes bacterium]|nr:hypothetical protein [Planctomycetota bacterium]
MNKRVFLQAAVSGWQLIEAKAGEDGSPVPGKRLRRFSMVAYTGGPMELAGWPHPVVVDLAGLKVTAKGRPILKDHNPALIVGHTDQLQVTERELLVAGVISGTGAVAGEIIASSENGFPWQASIGARPLRVVFIPEGKHAEANGQQFSGPLFVVRKALLGEVSFVALGADDNTSASVAANAKPDGFQELEIDTMDFEQWLAKKGFKLAEISEEQAASLKAAFEKEQKATLQAAAPETPAGAVEPPVLPPASPATPPQPGPTPEGALSELRTQYAADIQRIEAIQRICGDEHRALAAKAISEGWDVTRTELEVLRASRPKIGGVAAHGARQGLTTKVLEAACALTARLLDAEKQYDEQTLDAATKRFRGGIGMQELLLEAAWANGYTGRNFRDSREVLRFAFAPGLAAGFSTIDIGGILSNVANKFLLEGFFSVERTWRNICAIRNVSDFKTVTSYRLIGTDQYELVAPGGELKHGTLGNETYQNKADTYGLRLSIDRRDIINDDLGAITTVPRKLGRGSGLKINDVFWATFLDNAAFFTDANKTFLAGVDTALGIDGLTKAEVAFMDQVDADGKPIGIMPAILLVPTALSAMATQLRNSLEIRDTSVSTKYPVSNPHQGKFRTEVSRYLSNARYTGFSSKAWFLLADPGDLPVIEVAFLNGQESPTIETAEADFAVLGIQMRGYHDFGVALQDARGGIKMLGQAAP